MERVLSWLEAKAGDYLRWRHEQAYARAKRTEPKCPDCEQPESFCWCEEKDREREMMQSAFDAGMDRAAEMIERRYW